MKTTDDVYFVVKDGNLWGVYTFAGNQTGPMRCVKLYQSKEAAENDAKRLNAARALLEG
jgi:hypothetical protein